jgi:hypothetical protein
MKKLNGSERFAIAEAVAQQVAVEQQLVATRMSWNLTFQGFMIASYALIAAADTSEPARFLIQMVICAAGLIVAAATYAGVIAASSQSSFLKARWKDLSLDSTGYPRPFSIEIGAKLGRLPPRVICGTVALMWIALIILTWVGQIPKSA